TLTAKTATTLLEFLTGEGLRRTKIKQLVKYRAISVAGTEVAQLDHRVPAGAVVCIKTAQEMRNAEPPPGLPVVYEDDAIIVIIKPTGLLSIATEKEKQRTAYYRLNAHLKERDAAARIFVVHRLDRDTSGLLVFAKSEAAKRALQDQWPEVEKRYVAVVEGVPAEPRGTISSCLRESKSLRVHTVRGKGDGKLSVTHYEVVAAGSEYALLHITLTTGRKNQIRVHLADLGHPVAGDKKYGAVTDPVGRLALHAASLAFAHPLTGKRLALQAPVPKKFLTLFPKGTGITNQPASPDQSSAEGAKTMSKAQDSKKETKKAPAKSMKEKRAEKKAKKAEKSRG
ncbi:MAG TPA: RluA family pseudouridine synthase, partial [Desulfurivibrionaceae bacterium]|nr:RluA family pseudouridine synthase [Desulfurivibrionaceae bacterium]